MRCGDIFFFRTGDAKNYTRKDKFHICVCLDPIKFLFINSKFNSTDDFEISRNDWQEMPLETSYISCGTLLDDYYFNRYHSGSNEGHLSDDALNRLLKHIEETGILEGEDIQLIADAIFSELNP